MNLTKYLARQPQESIHRECYSCADVDPLLEELKLLRELEDVANNKLNVFDSVELTKKLVEIAKWREKK